MLLRGLAVFLAVGLTVYALIDCARTDSREVQALPKAVWLLVIVVVPVIGPIAWILTGRSRRRPGPTRPSGPVAPDDDPEFLRRLEMQRRRQADEERLRRWEEDLRRREQDGGTPGGPGQTGSDPGDTDRQG